MFQWGWLTHSSAASGGKTATQLQGIWVGSSAAVEISPSIGYFLSLQGIWVGHAGEAGAIQLTSGVRQEEEELIMIAASAMMEILKREGDI